MTFIELAKLTSSDAFGSRSKIAVIVLFTLMDLNDRKMLPVTMNELSEFVANVLNVKVISVYSNIGKVLSVLEKNHLVNLTIVDENNNDRLKIGKGMKKIIDITDNAKELFGRV